MAGAADPRKQQHWLRHIRRWQGSRLTIRQYGTRHQLSEAGFYSWKRTLLQRGLLTDAARSGGPQPRDNSEAKPPLFLPVSVSAADATTGRIDLVLPDGWTVRVAAGFDAVTLRQLLALLRE
jgi:hypothetical protein